jgi:hypothetical protein
MRWGYCGSMSKAGREDCRAPNQDRASLSDQPLDDDLIDHGRSVIAIEAAALTLLSRSLDESFAEPSS